MTMKCSIPIHFVNITQKNIRYNAYYHFVRLLRYKSRESDMCLPGVRKLVPEHSVLNATDFACFTQIS